MKALIVIEIDENHLLKEANELYERLKGYECKLKPMPEEKKPENPDETWEEMHMRFGWNDCLEEIEK